MVGSATDFLARPSAAQGSSPNDYLLTGQNITTISIWQRDVASTDLKGFAGWMVCAEKEQWTVAVDSCKLFPVSVMPFMIWLSLKSEWRVLQLHINSLICSTKHGM